eukprot:TRINITY_DN5274_c0_g1_i1.p1 TRINITY_DN5274_c0_g1~~TRINITY_DN5274_c0_g1_i1.p1  ORF type:complete len:906 (+),score=305.86 TRINITY_DN5274_c0_g1_i1:28-2718(+)
MNDICPWMEDVGDVKSTEPPAMYDELNGKRTGMKRGSILQILEWLFFEIEDEPFVEESTYFLHSFINLFTGYQLLDHVKEMLDRPHKDKTYIKARAAKFIHMWAKEHMWEEQDDEKFVEKVLTMCRDYFKEINVNFTKNIKKELKSLKVRYGKSKGWLKLWKRLDLGQFLEDKKSEPLLSYPPSEIAQQLTYIESLMFNGFLPSEFKKAAWTKKDKEEKAPNIHKLAVRFNQLSFWVSTEILTSDNRPSYISKFIKIAYECYKVNNFNSMAAIIAGLNNSSVTRLTKDWKNISKQDYAKWSEILLLMNPQGNFRDYKNYVINIKDVKKEACLPYMAPALGNLFYSLELPNLVDGQINYKKFMQIGKQVAHLLSFRTLENFKITEKTKLATALFRITFKTPEELYQISCKIKPLDPNAPNRKNSSIANANNTPIERKTVVPTSPPLTTLSTSLSSHNLNEITTSPKTNTNRKTSDNHFNTVQKRSNTKSSGFVMGSQRRSTKSIYKDNQTVTDGEMSEINFIDESDDDDSDELNKKDIFMEEEDLGSDWNNLVTKKGAVPSRAKENKNNEEFSIPSSFPKDETSALLSMSTEDLKRVDRLFNKCKTSNIEISKEEVSRYLRLQMNRVNEAYSLIYHQKQFFKEINTSFLSVSLCNNFLKKNVVTLPLESVDKEDRQVIYFQMSNAGKKPRVEEIKLAFSYLAQVSNEKIQNQYYGATLVFDCRDFKWESLTRTFIFILFNHLQSSIPMRLDSILFVEPPNSFKSIWTNLSSIMNKRLLEQSRVVTLEELKTHISPEKLLSTFGGSIKFNNKTFIQERTNMEPQQANKDLIKLNGDDGEEGENTNLVYVKGNSTFLRGMGKAQKKLASYFDNINNDGVYAVKHDEGEGESGDEKKDVK